MTEKTKAQRRRGMAKGYHKQQNEFATKCTDTQPPIAPGTALSAFLKRYRFDLLSLPLDRHISQLLDCVDCILDEEVQYD